MLRVLIVDDEFLLTILLSAELEQLGCEVGTAANGRAAVEFCRANRPDVVLMDIRMPVMDGLEATRLIMAENPTCIVVMTAYGDATTAARAEAAGAMGYLTKPVSADEILAAVGPAQARLAEFRSIRAESADLEEAVETRRVVEVAKRVIAEQAGAVTGAEFDILHQLAAEKGITLRAVAEEIAANGARAEGGGAG